MSKFLRVLVENPILLVFLIGWIASLIGGVTRKAARRAAAEAERARQRARAKDAATRRAGQPDRPTVAAPTVQPTRAERKADEVADELRRMLGLDDRPGAGDVRYEDVEVVEPPPEPKPLPVPVEPDPELVAHGGDLSERLAQKERERAARFENRIEKRAAAFRSSIADRHLNDDLLGRASTAAVGNRSQRRARRRGRGRPSFDASDPVRAIIAMEVLGPPRGERGWPDQ